jgi:hypothetical protein
MVVCEMEKIFFRYEKSRLMGGFFHAIAAIE